MLARMKGMKEKRPLRNAHRDDGVQEEVGATSGKTHQRVLEDTVGHERGVEAASRRSAGDAE